MKRFKSFDGTKISFHEWGAPSDEPPVVLQHGYVVNSWVNWVQPGVVDALVDDDRWVIAVDARGHGDSEKPHDPEFYGESRMARDLTALFDVLGLEEVHLVGYSMGAVVSLLATTDDERVSRLVIGGVGAGVVEVGGVDTRVTASAEGADLLAAFDGLAEAVGADREALAVQASVMHSAGVPLDRVTAPTLVLAGDADQLAARPEVLVDKLPEATTLVLPGDHLSVVADPRFTESIVDFLAL